MARLRYNLLETTLGAQLDAAATSITFAAKLTAADGDIPTISGGDYLPLVIGNEIVHLTAYTAEATSGTVSRGEEGTTDATHTNGTAVRNTPAVADYPHVAASAPPNPAVGQLWVDTSYNVAIVNVIDYGATGDGTTNDTDAIAAAAATAVDSGLMLYFPAGTYITDPFNVGGAAGVFGDGHSSVVRLRAQNVSALGDHGLIQVYGTWGAPISTGFVMRDILIDGNKANMTGTTTLNMEGIDIKHLEGGRFYNVRVINAISEGFDIDHSTDCVFLACSAYNCGGNGFHCSNGAIDNALIGCLADTCGADNSRNGFDQYDGSAPEANRNRYIGCIARSCYRNFNIDGTEATFIGNASVSGSNADSFTASMLTGSSADL